MPSRKKKEEAVPAEKTVQKDAAPAPEEEQTLSGALPADGNVPDAPGDGGELPAAGPPDGLPAAEPGEEAPAAVDEPTEAEAPGTAAEEPQTDGTEADAAGTQENGPPALTPEPATAEEEPTAQEEPAAHEPLPAEDGAPEDGGPQDTPAPDALDAAAEAADDEDGPDGKAEGSLVRPYYMDPGVDRKAGAKDRAAAPKAKKTAPAKKAAAVKKTVPQKAETAAEQAKRGFRDLDTRELDRDLSPEERQEWESIYASYTSKSVLTGRVVGMDENTFTVQDASGKNVEKHLRSLVIINYRVKVLIPETEMWMPGEEQPNYILKNMEGCELDYVILNVDRRGECAIASRRMALSARRWFFGTSPQGHPKGEINTCRLLSVGPTRCLVECGGYDVDLRASDLTYAYVPDLRERYRPGEKMRCKILGFDKEKGPMISIKEAKPSPFRGAEIRHPINSRRTAVISNKYKGGIYCVLPDETTCRCRYTSQLTDDDFQLGDQVIMVVDGYDQERELVRGRILKKW